MEGKHPLASIPDDELLRRLAELLSQPRRSESELVAHIGEVDERKLYAREGSPSMLADGRLHLTAIADRVGTPVLELRPDGVELPVIELSRDAVAPSAPMARAVVQPLAPARYKVQFTTGAELHGKLERLRALMRSTIPDGDLAAIIDEAVTEKLERLEARRFAKVRGLPGQTMPGASIPPSASETRARSPRPRN